MVDSSDVENSQPPVKRARLDAKADSDPLCPDQLVSNLLHRNKIWTEDALKSCFVDGLLQDDRMDTLSKAYKTSSPYLHACLPALVQSELLAKVRQEIVDHLVFTEKETDIYRVYQTGDLANIDGLSQSEKAQLAHLHKLRNALYSSTFRSFISRVTGCGPLSGSKQDMSINSYRQGSHLLNHDDVIGTRRVSYILYLPEPQAWKPAFGGALELYPCAAKGTPDVAPTLVIPPKWNQFVFFTVQPGYSFHSVQEVVAPHDRLSISGWFHVPQEGESGYSPDFKAETEASASLDQLNDDVDDTEFPFTILPQSDTNALTLEDKTYLAEFINQDYLNETKLSSISNQFCAESSVQLVDFLNEQTANNLMALLCSADDRDGFSGGAATSMKHGAGICSGWTVQGSPVKQRFMVLATKGEHENEMAEVAPLRALQTLLRSQAFAKWLHQVCMVRITHSRERARRFRPGLDYSLATFSAGSDVLDTVLCVTPPHPSWEEGEWGGYECYVGPDSGNDDPAIYRANLSDSDDGALLTQPAAWNVLSLVLRDQGVMKFIKYVSGLANGSRWDFSAEYLVDEQSD